jgi:hypothetical protein
MDYLVDFLKAHHPDMFKQVIAAEILDLSALTQPEIDVIAEKHFRDR